MSILGGIICGAVAYLAFLILLLLGGRRHAARLDALRREHYARIADHEHIYRGEPSDGPRNLAHYREQRHTTRPGRTDGNGSGGARRRQ